MNIGFIGAGKVGCAFGRYLHANDFEVSGYLSKTYESAQRGAKAINGVVYNTIEELIKSCSIVFITTPDDVIEDIAIHINKNIKISTGQVFVHMSGALSSEVLKPIKEEGGLVYSLHPLQAFADIESAFKNLKNTVFSIEGDKEKISMVSSLVRDCGNECIEIKKEHKAIYHASACVVSNYLVTLLNYGFKYYEVIGQNEDIAIKSLFPLIEGTIKNIKELGTYKALTGPIARGDVKTVKKHLKSLKEHAPELARLYKILGLETINIAEMGKTNNDSIEKLKKNLKEVECNDS